MGPSQHSVSLLDRALVNEGTCAHNLYMHWQLAGWAHADAEYRLRNQCRQCVGFFARCHNALQPDHNSSL